MSDVDRIVAALVASTTPLDRTSLTAHGLALAPDLAPLADPSAVSAAVDAIVGLGPLDSLLEDPDISDVLVNGCTEVWIERAGVLERASASFTDDESVIAMIRRLIAPLGLRIDRAVPAVDARLPDGARLHAVIPPASVDGPVLAIRRFHPAVTCLADLSRRGTVDDDQAAALSESVGSSRNILVAGPTGSGKTTLLNVLCGEIPSGDRIVAVEDAAELRLTGHVVRLEAHVANTEGVGDVTLRQLLRHALRLRPDRIVVGEVRGPEALDMVQALNTGHRGSMSTIHADGVDEALVRLETLAAMAPEAVPPDALRSLVRSAIDVVVDVRRDGARRRVVEVTEVGGRPS
jgi:pilus assembly protein CpaF